MNNTTPEQYLKRFKEITDKMLEVTTAKNKDYSWEALAFKNFETISFLTDWKTTTEQGFLVRMTDKITRIANLLETENAVVDEKLEDTLLDLSIYSILFKIYLDTNNNNNG